VSSAQCSGSRSGKRAVNWVVLQDRESGRELVLGGTHISYCSGGCDSVHECELKEMYRKLEKMRKKYNAPVVWMGDMNRKMDSRIMRNVLKGKVGSMRTFSVDDLVQTDSHTYYTGGSAIDHILGESGKFRILGGGRTDQGERGQKLKGADHFPVYAEVHVLKSVDAAASGETTPAPATIEETTTSAESSDAISSVPTSPASDSTTSQVAQPPTEAIVDVSGQSEAEDAFVSKMLEWNVHYKNRDHRGIAGVIADNKVDIVGLCELTGSMSEMARALSRESGRDFRVQPGRERKGFGTDIFYDNGKWKALEGGVSSAQCSGSRSGKRAVNWVVLQDRESGRELVLGGTHISYCSGGCDSVHECELKEMYRKLEKMRKKYNAPVVWMGDMNRKMDSRIMRNVLKGKVGSMRTFSVDDLVQTDSHTYYTGGSAIDHILGESGKFRILGGGRTDQGERGQKLKGADHFPVYAEVHVLK